MYSKELKSRHYCSINFKMKVKKGLKLVIFDLDGVLLDSIGWIRKGEMYALEKFGIKFDEKRFEKNSGIPTLDRYKIIAPKIDPREIYKIKRRWQEDNLTAVKPFPKAKFVLRELSKKYLIALFTGRRKFLAKKHIKIYGLDKYFKMKVFADDVKEGKPHPEGLKKILKKLKIKPKETIYIGDSVPDFLAAKASKVKIIGALYGVSRRLIKGKADYEIKKLEDVLKVIEKIDSR